MDVLGQLFDPLDVVGGEAEPGEKLELLETLHGDDAVPGQVEDLQVTELADLKHAEETVVLGGKLKERERETFGFLALIFSSLREMSPSGARCEIPPVSSFLAEVVHSTSSLISRDTCMR